MKANTDSRRLIFNADILCMDDVRSEADALVYSGGVIEFVGGEAQTRQWLRQHGGDFEQYDARGGCLLPGFIDAHLHPMLMAVYQHSVDLTAVTTIDELTCRVDRQLVRAKPGCWILGLQLDEQLLPGAQLPDRWALDAICGDRPLVLFKRDGHSIAVNSLALELAGLAQACDAVAGGTIETDTAGRPCGILRENAVALVMAHFVPPSAEQLLLSAHAVFDTLSAQGITSIGAILQTDDEGPGGASSAQEAAAMAALADSSSQAIYSILIGETVPPPRLFRDSELNAGRLGHKTRAFKIFADGTLGSCTACMQQGFFDQPDNSGYMTLSMEQIYSRMVAAHQQGWQICIHAIGDKAVANCVELYQRLLQQYPRCDHRHRIEHASVVDSKTIKKIAELGLVLCCQPLFIRSERHWLEQRLGPQRVAMAYPFATFLAEGITVAGSSDAPIEDCSVLAAIECCVTRDGFSTEQCLTVDQAIALYTRNAAYAQFEEREKGSLEPGKRADMVLLSHNPHRVDSDRIGAIEIRRTVCGGRETFIAPSAAQQSQRILETL